MLNKLQIELIKAIREDNTDIKLCIRMVLSNIKNKSIELKRELTDAEIIEVISKEIKQINETLEFVENREDIKTSCLNKKAYLQSYVPTQMTEQELYKIISEGINVTKTAGDNIGTAMKTYFSLLKGKADNKLISETVKKVFSERK